MAKVKDEGNGMYSFYCPGCGHDHVYYTQKNNHAQLEWHFNGDINNPTFTPSLLNRWGNEVMPGLEDGGRCHLFVTNGKIDYCDDCSHSYNGQKGVEMRQIGDILDLDNDEEDDDF